MLKLMLKLKLSPPTEQLLLLLPILLRFFLVCPSGKRRSFSSAWVLLLIGGMLSGGTMVLADVTIQGPSGFIQTPSARTIDLGQLEFAVHTRAYSRPMTGNTAFMSHLALGFSPLRDVEIGVGKEIDSRRGANDFDPDPTLHFKVRLPPLGSDEFSEIGFGMLLDTNPNNYHTMFLSVGGFGVGWNFGGNPGSGIARYGSFDRAQQRPNPLCLLVGIDYPPRQPGERGYRSHYLFDYNGDVFSCGWRFKSHRGFWVDAALSSKTTYSDWRDYQPLTIGFGAIF